MTKTTVWLNTHFNCIALMRKADADGEFRIVTSYPNRKYPDVLLADTFEVEPKLTADEYVQYALDFVRRHRIDVFLPGRRVNEIAAHQHAFEDIGCRVILAADPVTLALLDNKGQFYDSLAKTGFVLPDFAVAGNPDEFVVAVESLQQRNEIVCFKPTVGIFGFGFRIIETPENAHLLQNIDRNLVVSLTEAQQFVGKGGKFQEQIVLEYLPGVERSVDCLAHNGELVHCVVRRKLDDGSRVLERHLQLEAQTAELVQHLQLDGLFNVQFKDRGSASFLLEINARMSGGISMSCLWGMVFPYWAVKLAINPAYVEDIPPPGSGTLRVAELSSAVILD